MALPYTHHKNLSGSSRYSAGLGRTYYLDMSVCLVLFASFFIAVGSEVIPFSAAFDKVKWVIFLVITSLAIVRALSSQQSMQGFSLMNGCFLMFVIVCTISSATTSDYTTDAFDGVKRSFSFFCLYLISFIFVFPADPNRRIMVWTKAILVICLTVSFASILCIPLGIAFSGARLRGIAMGTNTLSTICAMMTTACFAMWFQKVCKYRTLWLLIAGLNGLMLLMTQSRSALAAAVVGIIIIMMTKHKWVLPLCAVLSIPISGILFTDSIEMIHIGKIGEQEIALRSFTIKSRQGIWEEQLARFETSPLIGHGLQMSGAGGEGRVGAESSYGDLIGAGGLLGGGAIMLGLLIGLYRIYKLAKQQVSTPNKYNWAYPVALAIVVTILVNAIGEGYMAAVGAMQPIYVWVILGAVCAGGWRKQTMESGTGRV